MRTQVSSSAQRTRAFSRNTDPPDGLVHRVARLLDKVDYRLATFGDDRDAIFRLRYNAYGREGGIPPNRFMSFSDPYDETGLVHLFGVYVEGELASSIRVHVASKETPAFPSFEVFPDFLRPLLARGNVIVDSTRFVTDDNLAKLHRGLPYATLRLSGMVASHFAADYLLAAVRPEHQAFYRRVFRYQTVCEPRSYPLLNKPVCLMAVHYRGFEQQVHKQFPFFRSTFFERRMLLENRRSDAYARGAAPQNATRFGNSRHDLRHSDQRWAVAD